MFCTDEDASVCLERFDLKQATKVWTCEEGGNKTKASSTEEAFNVFPNPSKGVFKVELLETNSTLNKLHILDVNGKIVQTHKINSKQNTFSLSLVDLPDGVYWVQLVSAEGNSSKKIIIH